MDLYFVNIILTAKILHRVISVSAAVLCMIVYFISIFRIVIKHFNISQLNILRDLFPILSASSGGNWNLRIYLRKMQEI